jgi:hypothetical protein
MALVYAMELSMISGARYHRVATYSGGGDEQTNKQTDRQTDKQKHRYTYRYTYRQTDRQTDR